LNHFTRPSAIADSFHMIAGLQFAALLEQLAEKSCKAKDRFSGKPQIPTSKAHTASF